MLGQKHHELTRGINNYCNCDKKNAAEKVAPRIVNIAVCDTGQPPTRVGCLSPLSTCHNHPTE